MTHRTTTSLLPGIHVTDHTVDVPLDWRRPDDGRTISLFARELVDPLRRDEALPVLVFLQGGPGGKGPRPVSRDGWIAEAMRTFRLVLLDQRGTGRSTRIDGRSIAAVGDPAAQAEYLERFRADSIVDDAEYLRRTVFGGRRWSTLGQSYGGFLTLTYLSRAPEGLAACYVTGGLAGIHPSAAEVYRRTYPRTERKNRAFAERYPQDVDTVARIADRLAAEEVLLPDGDRLTVRRFQNLGIDFGMKPGYERLHWLLDEAFDSGDRLSDTFLAQVWARTSYIDNPLFIATQESIYGAEGAGATGWAAQAERDARPVFAETARPLLFTGEMVYPWMFEEIRSLRPFQGAVERLSAKTDWDPLYDPAVLQRSTVPLAAAVYYDDMYVDAQLQLETVDAVGGATAWVTNEYEHDGIQDAAVVRRLFSMVDERGGRRADEEQQA